MRGEDLTGRKFFRLTVIEPCGRSKNKGIIWLCKCDCGNMTTAKATSLKNGDKKSCGCWHKEESRLRMAKMNESHGRSKERIYSVWATMKTRCSNPRTKKYADYGGRGISVCEEWQSFEPFYEWSMSHGYADDLTIDRIDVNGNYCPENCRWITVEEQSKNRRDTVHYTIDGVDYCRADAARILGINYSTLRWRERSHPEIVQGKIF